MDEQTKKRVCVDIWNLIAKLPTIPKPPEFGHIFQCSADGTPTTFDPLLDNLMNSRVSSPVTVLLEDEAIKARICQTFPDMRLVFDAAADELLVFSPTPLTDDTAVRARIYQRYLYRCGRRQAEDLPAMLPHSDHSVFTNGDIVPRNIMVDKSQRIAGILNGEAAGWYPDY